MNKKCTYILKTKEYIEFWQNCSEHYTGLVINIKSQSQFVCPVILIFISHCNTVWITISSVLLLSHIQLSAAPWTAAHQASLSTNAQNLLKLMSIVLVMPSNHLILSYPFLLLPLIVPSMGIFSKELVLCIRWPKYCRFSFSFSISPTN